jgi:Na+/phosphate symporter
MVLSIEERVFLVEYFLRESTRYTDLVQEQFAEKSAVYRDRPRKLNELKTAITAFIINISQADLQKVFANNIKRVQACIGALGHHFQQPL